MGSMFMGTVGRDADGHNSSNEDLKKLTSVTTTRSEHHGEQKPRHIPIQVTIDEQQDRKGAGTLPLVVEHPPRRGGSSASDGTFSSRRELRQEV